MLYVRSGSLALAAILVSMVPRALEARSAPDAGSGAAAALLSPPGAGDVTGAVKDSAGAPLPNVQVIIAAASRATTTDGTGRFVFRGLPPGEYHISTLLIGYSPGHAVVVVGASGDAPPVSIVMTSNPLRLQAVSVTASGAGSDPERVAQATVEVSGLALQRSLSGNIAQTLGQEPGISVRFNGPAAMPVIRGLTGDRILVLQDGARTGDLSSASADHENTVDPLSANRIEVVRGPASLLYGNNALGGVVNVVSNDIPTAVPTHLEGTWGAIGESATPGGSAMLSVTTRLTDTWAFTMRGGMHSASALRVGGGEKLENTQSRNSTVTAGLGYVGDNATLGGSVANYGFNYGLPHPEGEPGSTHIVGSRTSGNIRASVNTPSSAFPLLKLDASVQDYRHDEVSDAGEVGTSFLLRTQTVNVSSRTAFGRVAGSVGVQMLFKQYDARGEEALTPAANSGGLGAFFYQEIPFTRAPDARAPTLSFGGRYDTYAIESRDSSDPRFGAGRRVNVTSPSGSVGLSVPIGSVAVLSANAAMAFRAPTVEELFANAVHEAAGEYEIGNPNLRAEQSHGYEAVLKAGSGDVSASLSAYVNEIDRYVYPNVLRDTTVEGVTMPLARIEQQDARISGFEGQVEYRVLRRLLLGAMGDYTRGSFVADGRPLPFMPPGRVGGSVRWDDGRWNVGVDARHGFAQSRVTGGSDVATDAFNLVNLSGGVRAIVNGRVHTVTLRVDNAGDVRYYDATSRIKAYAPNPGRNFALVYRMLF